MALVFVTGGSRGLGFETAKALKAQGHQIVLFARDTQKLHQAGQELNSPIEFVELSNIEETREVFHNAVKIENAVKKALAQGYRTADIYTDGTKKVKCSEMGDAVVAAL